MSFLPVAQATKPCREQKGVEYVFFSGERKGGNRKRLWQLQQLNGK